MINAGKEIFISVSSLFKVLIVFSYLFIKKKEVFFSMLNVFCSNSPKIFFGVNHKNGKF